MPDDYYAILGVDRSASADEIQKAYRRLARKYHPDLADDKEAAKQKFQKVQHAYDVLSDPKKRQLYDQFGPEFERGGNPFQGGQMPNGFDAEQMFGQGQMPPGGFEEILKQVFGSAAAAGARSGQGHHGGFPGGGFPGGFPGGGGTRSSRPKKGQDTEQSITIPFGTAVLGGKHQLSLKRSSGKVDNITVSIPAGITDGKKIRLKGQGHSSPNGGPRGDMFVIVNVAPHPVFRRNGDNLFVELPITISEAVSGAKIDLPTPHGEVTITVPAGSSSGKRLRLKGMGMARDKKGATDLIVELKIVVPDNLSDEQKETLKQICDSTTEEGLRSKIAW